MSYAVLALTICEKPNGLSSADSRQLRIIQRKLSVAVLAISTVHSIQSALERALEQPVVHVSSLGAYTLEDSNNSATPKDAFTPLFSIEDVIYSAIRFAQSKVIDYPRQNQVPQWRSAESLSCRASFEFDQHADVNQLPASRLRTGCPARQLASGI